MKRFARLFAMVVGLTLMLNNTSSGGTGATCVSPGCNSTTSDVNRNTAGGTFALDSVDETATGGFDNTAFGTSALQTNDTGDENTASGAAALFSNTTGSANTATGYKALLLNTTGNNNTATGHNALFSNDTGSDNTATGVSALQGNTTGIQNTASGTQALLTNSTGSANTATGGFALQSNTTGNNNTATGLEALLNNTTGSHNSALGHKALHNNTAGLKNTAVGRSALFHSTGSQNIAIGYQAGTTLTTGNNDIYLGNPGNGDESLTMRLGNIQNRTFIAGIAGNTSVANAAPVVIDTTTGQLGIELIVSSARYKRDIVTMGARSEGVLQLRPVTFAYKDDAKGTTHYGLIAEEVEKVYPDLVTHTATGEVQTVKYQELIPLLLNELQRQQRELAEVGALRKELAELRALVGQGREMAASSR